MMEERFRAVITSTTNLGAGVARAPDGRVVFVSGAVAGDVADVTVGKARGSFYEAAADRIVSPSENRIQPDCVSFSAGCGGCTFRHVSYSHELSVKSDFIRSAMKKCGLDITPGPFLTSGPGAVRSKVTVPVGDGASGYYARASKKIVPSRRCLLHDEETDGVRAFVAGMNVPGLARLTVRRASEGTMLILRADAGAPEEALFSAAAAAAEKFPFLTSVYVSAGGEYTRAAGEEAIFDTLAGCRFRISPDSFYQVNRACAELLYERVIALSSLSPGERLADLYCGTGTIGIAAAKRTPVSLTGIEINSSAVADARKNAAENSVDARFILGDASSYSASADCVIVDPPRAGCDRRLISHLCKMKPDRIVYVSCNPATLARDASALVFGGYRIVSLTPVDMFPRTSHVETVCLLSRPGVGQP